MTGATTHAVRVILPGHCQRIAGVGKEVVVEVSDTPTVANVLDQVERLHPTLRGTIRDHDSGARRAYLRYFACGEDISHEDPHAPLPAEVVSGKEVLRVLGAIAGG